MAPDQQIIMIPNDAKELQTILSMDDLEPYSKNAKRRNLTPFKVLIFFLRFLILCYRLFFQSRYYRQPMCLFRRSHA